MNLYTVIYLLNKIYLNKVNNDNSQSNIFIKLAYNKVIKLMIERFSETEKITESKLNELNITNNMKDKLLNKLTEIDGIGKSKALELIKLGINSIADLKKKKWYDLLNKTTKAYLNYKPLKQIPYNFIKSLEKYITSYNKNQIKIVGGYARKKKNSKDIDLVFINSSKNKIDKSSEIDKYIEYLKQYFTIIIYLRGDDKLSLLIKLKTNYGNVLYKNINTKYIKVDIFITNENEKYFMILYGTGSKEFNIKMRGIARRKGYILNQKHLMRIKDNNKIWVSSEKEIFDILDMEYTKPETR